MAKSDKVSKPDTPSNVEWVRVQEKKQEAVFKKLTLSIDAKYKVTGRYSGREYLFERAGSTQDVEQIDVEWMLSLRQGERQCCGGTDKGNKVFVLA